ncbi:hypothetical protein LROSRS0_1520 [Furfurilactobacillus rossiae]|nr:hypothetical protein LROSRS0_1520 [Furfurilactobacillus rossiae]
MKLWESNGAQDQVNLTPIVFSVEADLILSPIF